ncbi:hypothetical protein B0H15DRAFT_806280 [Mycena belliarum]|uniref:Uncharacterized protein n=1 Tax=Mycena belliarum TaxID=1033014 RepID=A0AAD6TPE2_9AGAR|nr:hypothetical protein B0H15DRAFT_806280 [Mycena belliae]
MPYVSKAHQNKRDTAKHTGWHVRSIPLASPQEPPEHRVVAIQIDAKDAGGLGYNPGLLGSKFSKLRANPVHAVATPVRHKQGHKQPTHSPLMARQHLVFRRSTRHSAGANQRDMLIRRYTYGSMLLGPVFGKFSKHQRPLRLQLQCKKKAAGRHTPPSTPFFRGCRVKKAAGRHPPPSFDFNVLHGVAWLLEPPGGAAQRRQTAYCPLKKAAGRHGHPRLNFDVSHSLIRPLEPHGGAAQRRRFHISCSHEWGVGAAPPKSAPPPK